MSRTDKDRPYWVKINDDTLLKEYNHNHECFGDEWTNLRGVQRKMADHCTAFEYITWQMDRYWFQLPCKRELLISIGYWKLPPSYRHHKHRRHRRDYLKRQVKIFNSQHELHGDYEFMNDDVYEPFYGENSYNFRQK